MARSLAQLGIHSIADLSVARPDALLIIPGIGLKRAEDLVATARALAPAGQGAEAPEEEPIAAIADATPEPVPESDPEPAKPNGKKKKKKPSDPEKPPKEAKKKKKKGKKKGGKAGKGAA